LAKYLHNNIANDCCHSCLCNALTCTKTTHIQLVDLNIFVQPIIWIMQIGFFLLQKITQKSSPLKPLAQMN